VHSCEVGWRLINLLLLTPSLHKSWGVITILEIIYLFFEVVAHWRKKLMNDIYILRKLLEVWPSLSCGALHLVGILHTFSCLLRTICYFGMVVMEHSPMSIIFYYICMHAYWGAHYWGIILSFNGALDMVNHSFWGGTPPSCAMFRRCFLTTLFYYCLTCHGVSWQILLFIVRGLNFLMCKDELISISWGNWDLEIWVLKWGIRG
jgi:hypothetical protein